jgi:hypothetical protein
MEEKIWTPNEIKQKDVIVFEVPILKIPITSRMVRYFVPSFIFSLIVFFILSSIRSIIIQSSIGCIMFPFVATIILNSPRDGKYIEDILKTKIKYKSKSGIVFNEKVARARRK